MLECLAARGLPFSKVMANTLPRFFQAKTKVHVAAREGQGDNEGDREGREDQRLEKVDGLKIWTDDKTWVLVRPSGTEPIIRVFAESDTEEKVGLRPQEVRPDW